MSGEKEAPPDWISAVEKGPLSLVQSLIEKGTYSVNAIDSVCL